MTQQGSSRNIWPKEFPQINWSQGPAADSLAQLRAHVIEDAQQAIDWYATKRKIKKGFAQWLRALAIVVIGLGGLVPLIGKWTEIDGRPVFDPVLSGILFGVAAILVLLDRFFGCTSAWVRFMKADQQICQLLKTFRFDDEQARLSWPETGPTAEQIEHCLKLCRSLVLDVDEIVQRETDAWIAEFQGVLKQIDVAAEPAGSDKPPDAPPRAGNGGRG